MKVIDTSTGEKLEANIEPVTAQDFKVIKKNKQFENFNWGAYQDKEVYKLRLKNDDKILGLMCIIDHGDEETDAIEIELLEVGKENIGAKKKLDYIGGCLIAFACRESFKRGHDGFVFLIPKTNLVPHYAGHYGFTHFLISTPQRPAGFMMLENNSSRKLIKKYLE